MCYGTGADVDTWMYNIDEIPIFTTQSPCLALSGYFNFMRWD